MESFLGYLRPDGSVGIRNWVLILPATREANFVGEKIADAVEGTKCIITTGDAGRPEKDRLTSARTLIGLGLNPNVAAVLIVGVKPRYGYKGFTQEAIVEAVEKSGKPYRLVTVSEEGGLYKAWGEGIRLARELVHLASDARREPCDLGRLRLGVKCGMSDPTSGIVGNPVVGYMFDKIVGQGGTAFFSETTEIIGAEDMVAERGVTPEVSAAILDAVKYTEDQAKATGEDIREINPIPANINAGITTLEEKSLGAIAKSGTSPIQGVLKYGERPQGRGLYFVDAWMSSLSLPVGYAACGAQLFLYQMGGGDLSDPYPPMPAVNSGVVIPMMYLTGNPRTYKKAIDSVDFSSGAVLSGQETIEEAGERLLAHIIKIASGSMTKTETFRHRDPVELFLEGPCL